MSMEIKTPASNSGVPEQFMYKNRLQEFTQKLGMPLPAYHAVNEGYSHAPKFRASVLVDGVTFTSPNTFMNRKAAEQDVAKLALESLSRKVECEGANMIDKDILFSKSILHEYAIKMKLAAPTYEVSKPEGTFPVYSATSFFNGHSFVGDVAKSKKEAEQLAARAVIQSVLANPNTRTVMCQIIKSKEKKQYPVFGNMGSSSNLSNTNVPLSNMQDNSNDVVNGKVETLGPEVEISNQGYTCEPSGGTNGNGSSQLALSRGTLVTATTSTTFNSVYESPAQHNQRNDEMEKVLPSVRPENSSDILNSLGKRSDELEEGGSETKKARTIEQLQTPPPTIPSLQHPQTE